MKTAVRVLLSLFVISSLSLVAINSNSYAQLEGPDGWVDLRFATSVSPSITSWDSYRLDFFAKGNDGQLYWNFWRMEEGYGEWVSLGGNLTSAPDCHSPAQGLIQCTAKGLFDWMMVIKGLWDRGTVVWTDWENVGGDLASGPTITAQVYPDNLVEWQVFARNDDDSLQGIRENGNLWGNWFDVPSSDFVGDPDCAYRGLGDTLKDPDCVLRSSSNSMLHNIGCCMQFSGGRFVDIGGELLSSPTITSSREERLDVLGRGPTGNLWHRFKDDRRDGTWSEWTQVDESGRQFLGDPDCVSVEIRVIHCIIQDSIGRVHYKRFDVQDF